MKWGDCCGVSLLFSGSPALFHSKLIFIRLKRRMNYFCRADSDPNQINSVKPGFVKDSNAK